MKNNNKVLSLLGLATKAGKIASGEFSTEKSVKSGKGFLVLVAADASENTKKKFRDMCKFYKVPMIRGTGKILRQGISCQSGGTG